MGLLPSGTRSPKWKSGSTTVTTSKPTGPSGTEFSAVLDCQPSFFDPATTSYHKVKEAGSSSEFYRLEGQPEGMRMTINKVRVPAPFDLTVYHFGCDIADSSV